MKHQQILVGAVLRMAPAVVVERQNFVRRVRLAIESNGQLRGKADQAVFVDVVA